MYSIKTGSSLEFDRELSSMSSDQLLFDASFFHNPSSDMASSDIDLQFLCESFSPNFPDSPVDDIFQAISDDPPIHQNPLDESSHFLDQNSPVLISSSPPIHQMENLSLLQTTLMQQLPFTNCSNSANGFADFSGLHGFEVKTEQCQMGFGSSLDPSLFPLSDTVNENVAKLMQRSFSTDSFEAKPVFSSPPLFDSLLKLPNFETPLINPPENSFLATLRKAYSTGDLPTKQETQTSQRPFSTPVAIEKPLVMEDTTFRVGRYSPEERQEKIDKYKAKRTHRNYNKTIKYACRKTLADNRPRIRGRFARNDETAEITKAPCLFKDEENDHHWNDIRMRRGDCEGRVRGGGQFMNSFGPSTQFEFHGFCG